VGDQAISTKICITDLCEKITRKHDGKQKNTWQFSFREK
jgi:hypothetical protein